jgi:4-amino-4-deoxy-L-arabinose transferase-like glycosyltransferase
MTTSRRLFAFAGLAILLLAALLRAPSLTAGQPYINYVDEGNFLHPVARMLRTGAWDPRSYMYPQLPTTLVAAAVRLYAPLYPFQHDGRTFQEDLSRGRLVYDQLEPFELLLAARLLSFLAGLGLVVLTGLYGRRLLGPAAGLFAAFLAAWLPPLVIRGSIATVDPWAALFSLACFFFADRLRTSARPGREALLSGVMAGLAFASKYPAVLAAGGVALTLLLDERPWRERLRFLMLAAAGTLAGMLAGMPALVLHPKDVVLAIQRQNYLYSHLPQTPRLWQQALLRAEWDLPYEHPELGLPFLLLAAAGAAVSLRDRDRRLAKTVAGWLVFLGVSVVLYLPKSFQAFRNLLPHMPLLCLLVAVLYARLRERLSRPLRGRLLWADLGAALAVLALFAAPVADFAWKRTQLVDSRTEAIDWLAAQTGPDHTLLILRELAFASNGLARLDGKVVLRRWPQSVQAIRGRVPGFLVTGQLERENTSPLDTARHPAVERGYVLRARFGENTTPSPPGWWRGNRQVIYVLEKKERRWKGKGRPAAAP